jgi:putative polyhydroxyalkanoate system protein
VSDVKVVESHQLGVEGAKKALEALGTDLGKYGMSIHWSGSQGELKGTGASGSIHVTDKDVTVLVKLGMIAKMAGVKADKLQDSIQRRVKAALAPKV